MWILQPQDLLKTVAAAGITVSLTEAGGLLVTPASALTAELRDMLKSNKATLVEYLQEQANDATDNERELIEERAAIMEYDGGMSRAQAERMAALHTAYLLHHWGCPTCCQAGQRRGTRCPAGAGLWAAYEVETP